MNVFFFLGGGGGGGGGVGLKIFWFWEYVKSLFMSVDSKAPIACVCV